MNILVTAATENELSLLCQTLNSINNKAIINGNNIYFAVTGIGMTITAYSLTKLLSKNHYDLVINIGIAGSFKEELKIGDSIIVEHEVFADLGISTPNGYRTVFEENIIPKNTSPFNNDGTLYCKYLKNYSHLSTLPKTKGITVNCISGEKGQIQVLQSKFNPDIETMEGAAFFYVCLIEKIPFIEIRTISNKVEERNKKNWNISLALNNLTQTSISFLHSI